MGARRSRLFLTPTVGMTHVSWWRLQGSAASLPFRGCTRCVRVCGLQRAVGRAYSVGVRGVRGETAVLEGGSVRGQSRYLSGRAVTDPTLDEEAGLVG